MAENNNTLLTTPDTEAAGEKGTAGNAGDSGVPPKEEQKGTADGGNKPADGGKPPESDGKPAEGDKPGDGASKDDDSPKEGAPESYADFTLPEKTPVTKEQVEGLKAVAKELNLTQEQAQRLVDAQVKNAQEYVDAQNSALSQLRKDWVEGVKSDPEIGGAKYQENVAVAVKALNRFGTDGLRELLNLSGFGDHPEMIRLLYKVGKAISEDTLVESDGKPKQSKPFYEKSNHVL